MNTATALTLIGATMICYLPFSKPFPGRWLVVGLGAILWLAGIVATRRAETREAHQARREEDMD